MFKKILIGVALVAMTGAAHAQGRCALATDQTVNSVPCIQFTQRFYATGDEHGIEEDSIVGIRTTDTTLDHDALLALATTRVQLAGTPGPGKYVMVDWVAVIRMGSTETTFTTGAPRIGVAIDTLDEGPLTVRPEATMSVRSSANPLFGDEAYVRRYGPLRFGNPQNGRADTPIVVGVSGSAESWNTAVALIPDTEMLRFIVRYRVIDTTTTFPEGMTP